MMLLLQSAGIIPDEHFGHITSGLIVFGVLLAVPVVMVAIAAVNVVVCRRRAAQAKAAYDPATPLRPGRATIYGAVEYARGTEEAVRVEVDQVGTERESSGNWSHSWEESDRRVKVKPFYIRDASGERVRVEPTTDVFLLDALDGVIRVNLTLRTRVAELTPGEQVYAVGVLTREHDPEARPERGGVYRGAPTGYVLRSPRSEPMLLSTEPLEARFLQRAKTHRNIGLVIALAMLAYQLVLTPYHARFVGETVEGTVTRKTCHTTDDREMCTIHAKAEGVSVANEVGCSQYNAMQKGDAVPVRMAAVLSGSWSTLGSRPTCESPYALIGLLVVLLMAGYYFGAVRRRRWYEWSVMDIGTGRLQESLEDGQEVVDSK